MKQKSPRPARIHFDLTTINLLIAIAEGGGVTRGADRLYLAPAAASRRIQELESQLGVTLFDRMPHGMALTDAGRAMLAHARTIAMTVVRMQDDAASFNHGEKGVVRIAAPKSAVIQFLPFDIQQCTRICPGVRIDLQEMNSEVVQQALKRGVVDLGIYEASLGSIDLPTLAYRDDQLVLVTARNHALASHSRATIEDIVSWDVIGLGDGSAISIALERQATTAGRSLRMSMRVGGFDSIAALIAQSGGMGVMPIEVARNVAGGADFCHIPIDGAWASRKFVLCHQPLDSLSLAAQHIIQVLTNSQISIPALAK